MANKGRPIAALCTLFNSIEGMHSVSLLCQSDLCLLPARGYVHSRVRGCVRVAADCAVHNWPDPAFSTVGGSKEPARSGLQQMSSIALKLDKVPGKVPSQQPQDNTVQQHIRCELTFKKLDT